MNKAPRRPLKLIAAAAAAAAVAVTALAVTDVAPADTSGLKRTITFQETQPRVALDDIPPRAKSPGATVSLGDRLIITGPIFTTTHKRLGTISGDCSATGSGPLPKVALLCTVAYQTHSGQIVANGMLKLGTSSVLPIVGGTGAYAPGRGTVTTDVKPAKGFSEADRITLSSGPQSVSAGA